ncbi:MAG: hypothetical protein WB698_11140 [Solirubrobacteraceae bacterium]
MKVTDGVSRVMLWRGGQNLRHGGWRSDANNRFVIAAVAIGLLACAVVRAVPAIAEEGGACENSTIRAQQEATYLPRCRAYELVGPAGAVPEFAEVLEDGAAKGGLAIEGAQASRDGERLVFSSLYPAWRSTKPNGRYLAVRGAGGWESEQVLPSLSPSSRTGCPTVMIFSPELTSGVLSDGGYQTGRPYCGHNEPAITGDQGAGWRTEAEMEFKSIFLRDSFEGAPSYQLVNQTPLTTQPQDANLQAASPDLSHVVFSEDAKLTPEAPATGEALYEWYDGAVHLVSVLPNGQGVEGYIADAAGANVAQGELPNSSAMYANSVSDGGARVVFKASEKLFMRLNAEQSREKGECMTTTEPCTVQIDASQAAGGIGGSGVFVAASADGSRVFFMDEASAKLTENTVSGSGENLYEFEPDGGHLTDLTAVSKAQIVGFAGLGEAAGSSYLYFVADGAFATGAVEGKPNLYVVHDSAAPVLVAPLAVSDSEDWSPNILAVRTSPDGHLVAFTSAHAQETVNFPTGYNNAGQNEIYLYNAQTQALSCLSCRPNGTSPQDGGATILQPSISASLAEEGPGYLQRYVLNDGTVFFQTDEPLLAQATPNVFNVYEYSSEGSLHLLSSGGGGGAWLVDASESGDDVFIATAQELVKRDADGAMSIYDVRVEGGFAEPAEESPACKGEECRGQAPTQPVFTAPISAGFSGPGNAMEPVLKTTLSRHQKLLKALSACKKKLAKRRRSCEAAARKKYGRKAAHKANSRPKGGR